MKDWIKKYVVEVGTFVVCGSICSGILFSMYGEDVLAWSRRYLDLNQTPRGATLVYQVDSGVPLFGGDTLSDAVTNQVARIRRVMGQPTEPDAPVLSWRDSRYLRDALPGPERQLCRTLSGVDFRDGDLRGVDLRGMNLSQGDFRGADLSGARLDGAVLRDANFENANLSDIDFRNFSEWGFHLGRSVPGVQFRRSNFEGVFVGRGLQQADFRDANLRNATIYAFSTSEMDIRGADLRGATFSFTYGGLEDRESTFDEALATLVYDENTQVEGLRLGAVQDTDLPFVQWALAHGALASFPRREPLLGRWTFRHWESYAVICEGPTAAEALSGHVARIRRELAAATGLRYPDSADWGEVRHAMEALPPETANSLERLLKSTRGIDLQGVDLRGADLRGLFLEGAVFRGTNLTGADLSDATLDQAYVVDANLRDARLHRTSLQSAAIRASSLTGSTWRDCNARGVKMTSTPLSGAEMACVDFTEANFKEVSFEAAVLHEVTMERSLLEDTRFNDSVLMAMDWRGSVLRWADFEGAYIGGNDFSGVVLHELSLAESIFGAPSRWEEAIIGRDRFGNLPVPHIIAQVETGGGRLESDSEIVSRIQGQRRQHLMSAPRAAMIAPPLPNGRFRGRRGS